MCSDEDFETAILLVLRAEGGFCQILNDAGGATNLGLTLKFMVSTDDKVLCDIDKDGDIDLNDLKFLTNDNAKFIYKKYFWDAYSLDSLSSGKVAYILFDMIINHGPAVIKRIKRVVSKVGNLELNDLSTDMDDETIDDINSLDVDEFLDALLDSRRNLYQEIVNKRPNNQKFLKGWLARVDQNEKNLKLFEN